MAPGLSFLREFKKRRRKITMLSVYDAPSAAMAAAAGTDILLVGDSVGTVLLGYASTAPVTMDEMIHHCRAARRGAPKAFLIGDMPLEGVRQGPRQALKSAKRFVKEGGCDAVKVEWAPHAVKMTELIVKAGIPLMGHVGLTPQTVSWEDGLKVQGREAEKALAIYDQAAAFQSAGAFSVVLECVPRPVAARITRDLRVPTIGIGAGPECDGQVLVLPDLLGVDPRFNPRFRKRYANIHEISAKAVGRYLADVRQKRFPQAKHSFGMDAAEWRRFNFLYDRKDRAT